MSSFISSANATSQERQTAINVQLFRYGEVALTEARAEQPKRQAVECFLRTGLDFLCSHNMLIRGESRRTFELPDPSLLELHQQGPTACFAMIAVMDNGKTNQTGRIEYGSVIRHSDPLLCTMRHFAWYFFYRWNIVRETPLRF